MKQFTHKEFVELWGPYFANRVLEIAQNRLPHGSVTSIEYVQAVAIADLIRQIDELRSQVKRLQDEARS